MQYLFTSQPCLGKRTQDARYFGSRVVFNFSLSSERAKRLQQMKTGYAELGRFGCTCSNRVHVRIVFIAKVPSAAVAGLTAYVWPERESGIVDRCTCQLLRQLTRGVAVGNGENAVNTCSLSNRKLIVKWPVVPHVVELVYQRLKMYQAWGMHTFAF